METKNITFKMYNNPTVPKTLFILTGFSIFGLSLGIYESELSLIYPISGFITGAIAVFISKRVRNSYTLTDSGITVAMEILSLTIVSKHAKYEDITDIGWEEDANYRFGYKPSLTLDSYHLQLGGGHIHINRDNKPDITFSAEKEYLSKLRSEIADR